MLAAWGFILFTLYHVSFARVPNVEPEYLIMLRETGQHEAFAKFLGLSDVRLVHPMEGRSEEKNLELFTNVSSFGDILLTQKQEEQARQGIDFYKYPGNKWPNNCIPYKMSEKDFTSTEVRNIKSAIKALSDRLKYLKIVPHSNQKDYVLIYSGQGCYSQLGRVGGEQPLSLQSRSSCTSTGTVQHEFMHAAGLMHEHCHPERDNFIKVLWNNIPSDWHSQYEKVNSRDFRKHGDYDCSSVMHYPVQSPSGKPAFEVLYKSSNACEMGQRKGATESDVQKLNNLYP